MPVSQETIRTRAYQLWEQQGRPIGRDLDHWWQAEQELSDDEGGLEYDSEGVENPGIGYSLGTTGEDVEDIEGDNTLEGDVLNDTEPDGSIQPARRGRTNK